MNCPLCGSKVIYYGLQTIECDNPKCKNGPVCTPQEFTYVRQQLFRVQLHWGFDSKTRTHRTVITVPGVFVDENNGRPWGSWAALVRACKKHGATEVEWARDVPPFISGTHCVTTPTVTSIKDFEDAVIRNFGPIS